MKYYIVGKGGLAKEVLFLCREVFGHLDGFQGFIDYKPLDSETECMGSHYPVIDEHEFLALKDTAVNIYLGIGDPITLSKVVEKFSGYNFPNLIHGSVVMDSSVMMDRGNIITAGCILTVDINIGSYNIFNLNSTVGHDTIIGNYNVFNPGANVSGSVKIGSRNLFGTNCTILQGLNINDDIKIGAGSVVLKSVDKKATLFGNPARIMLE